MHLALQIVSPPTPSKRPPRRVRAARTHARAQFNVLNLLSGPEGGSAPRNSRRRWSWSIQCHRAFEKNGPRWLDRGPRQSPGPRQHVTGPCAKGRAAWARARSDFEKSLRHVAATIPARSRVVAEKVLPPWRTAPGPSNRALGAFLIISQATFFCHIHRNGYPNIDPPPLRFTAFARSYGCRSRSNPRRDRTLAEASPIFVRTQAPRSTRAGAASRM